MVTGGVSGGWRGRRDSNLSPSPPEGGGPNRLTPPQTIPPDSTSLWSWPDRVRRSGAREPAHDSFSGTTVPGRGRARRPIGTTLRRKRNGRRRRSDIFPASRGASDPSISGVTKARCPSVLPTRVADQWDDDRDRRLLVRRSPPPPPTATRMLPRCSRCRSALGAVAALTRARLAWFDSDAVRIAAIVLTLFTALQ